jgi:ATP-binding cassette subfamily C protein
MRLRHARVLNILSGDIQRISGASQYLLQGLIAVIILGAQSVLSFALAPTLALFAFALLIVGAVCMVPMLRRARALGRFVTAANLTLLDTASQFLSGLKLALSQDLQGGFVAEYRETMRGLKTRQQRYFKQQIRGRVWLTTVTALVGAAVVMAGFGVFHLSAPLLITFLLVIGRMSGPAAQIQQGFQQLAHGLPAYESIEELLSELRRATPARTAVARPVPEGPLVLDAVTYQHPNSEGTVSHGVSAVSLRLLPGTFVGIAGASGAGKTTLADLLVGLLRPQSGRILAGGVPLDDTTLPGWRAQLSYVSQDPFLFHDTVRRNLRWARPDATEAHMWDALTLAGADGIVRRMEGGLDAIVGERGSLVSGGERQRIALARALLREPRLLIMDEATNAIDVDGERALMERLLAVRPRLTIVMIAHRAESLALCDRLLRMENGVLHDDAPAARQVQPAG